ncbi:hypothetical protein [Burkholderia sp. MBR-1]|uniref:hypothetical protein n=1 Tax=Burkholderia sp. MBR-1 TaxID=2732364 RepID=UPI0015EE6DD4|nr:hypothetical protein [Burkholderia sp. MBR-1]QMI49784.1 hypothetical protein MBR110_30405 [Burkholderia sp. MBR-1]
MIGTFHLALADVSNQTDDTLAREFLRCAKVRGIVSYIVRARSVRDDFEPILHDTWMVCSSKLPVLDKPANVYSLIYSIADRLALTAYRGIRNNAVFIASDDEDDLSEIIHTHAVAEDESAPTLEERFHDEQSTEQNRKAFAEKLGRLAWPEHLPRSSLTKRRAIKKRINNAPQGAQRPAAKVANTKALELRAIREQLGLTVEEFAVCCDASTDRMYSYLRGLVKSEGIMDEVLNKAKSLLPVDGLSAVGNGARGTSKGERE